jgi:hypothetical protein
MYVDDNYVYTAGWNYLQAFTFDGSTFTKVGEVLGDVSGDFSHCYQVASDGTYVYLAGAGAGLIAYSFDGSTFTKLNDIQISIGSSWGIDTTADYVYAGFTANGPTPGSLSVLSFDGSDFTTLATTNGVSGSPIDFRDVFVDCRGFRIVGAIQNEGICEYFWDGTTLTEVGRVDIGQCPWCSGDGTYVYGGLGTTDGEGKAGYKGLAYI